MVALRGLLKLKKSKNPRKTRIGQTPPTHLPIHFLIFVWNTYNIKKKKKYKKK